MVEAGRRAAWVDGRNAARLTLAGDLLGWAILLGRGGVFSTGHQYDHLARWGSEHAWMGVTGLVTLALVLSMAPARRWARSLSAASGCGIQTALAVSFGGGPVISTGFGTHVALALLGSWLVWRELENA